MYIKKYILSIFVMMIGIFFSNHTFASNNGTLSDALDLNYGVEKAGFNLSILNNFSFNNEEYTSKYAQVSYINSLLKSLIIKKYQNNSFDYYQVNGIITNYNNFIYYTNNYFKYIVLKEKNPKIKEYDDAIMENYRQMRMSYNRVQYLVSLN